MLLCFFFQFFVGGTGIEDRIRVAYDGGHQPRSKKRDASEDRCVAAIPPSNGEIRQLHLQFRDDPLRHRHGVFDIQNGAAAPAGSVPAGLSDPRAAPRPGAWQKAAPEAPAAEKHG